MNQKQDTTDGTTYGFSTIGPSGNASVEDGAVIDDRYRQKIGDG